MNKSFASTTSQTDWDRINAMQDEDIDLSDIPESTEEQMKQGIRRIGGQPTLKGKVRVNMYLDANLVSYFRSRAGERGYQTLINEALKDSVEREEMESLIRRVIREELQAA